MSAITLSDLSRGPGDLVIDRAKPGFTAKLRFRETTVFLLFEANCVVGYFEEVEPHSQEIFRVSIQRGFEEAVVNNALTFFELRNP